MNKKGQLSTTWIIAILIGIGVLVLAYFAIRNSWFGFSSYLSPSNVDAVVAQCSNACTTSTGETNYNYCSYGRTLSDGKNKYTGVTCYYLSQEQTQYGVSSCPSASCNVDFVTATSVDQLKAMCAQYTGKTIQALINNNLETQNC